MAFNAKAKEKSEEILISDWRIANFTGAAFAGKLKSLSHYTESDNITVAPKMDKDEFERRVKLAELMQNGGVQ